VNGMEETKGKKERKKEKKQNSKPDENLGGV
jgi:hypothetical protein